MTRVVFMGTPEFAVPSLAALLAEGYQVAGVYTRPDRGAGRGRQVAASPVKALARANGLPVYQPRTLRDEAVQAELAALAPDLIVVAAFGLIIPPAVLDLPRFGCLNVHGSLLPRHRGAAPIAAAIMAGDTQAGISIMRLDAGLDTGPVLSKASLPIAPDETTGSLTPRLARLGAELLVATLPPWLAGQLEAVPQDEAQATYAPRLGKDAGQIDWSQSVAAIARQVRAYNPWPSAFTLWRGDNLKVIGAHVADGADLPPVAESGLVVPRPGGAAGVIAGDGLLVLDEIQLAGKRILPVEAFLRGAPDFLGSRLPS